MGITKHKTPILQPLFSVIIPAHNEEDTIRKALESIRAQTEKSFEIIVVDDGSTDDTSKVIELYKKREPRLRLVISNPVGTSAAKARNLGAKYAKGKYILFHDADCVADTCLLNNAAKDLEDWDLDGVATRTSNTKPQSWIQHAVATQRAIRWENTTRPNPRPIMLDENSGINVAIMRKDVFDTLGGFNENIFYFEDNDLTKRFFKTGNTAMFDKDVIQYHQDPLTLRESLGQCKSIAKGIKTRGGVNLSEAIMLLIALYGLVNVLPYIVLFLYMSFKSKDLLGSFYFTILWELRSLAKIYYLFVA